MPYLAWSDDLNTQIPELDAQHRVMIDRLNGLRGAIASGSVLEAQTQIDALVECMRHHFEFEEKILQMIDFQGLAEHQQAHNETINAVEQQRTTLEQDLSGSGELVLDKLNQWLIEHIRHDDLDFGPVVREWMRDASPPDDPFRKLVGDFDSRC